MNEYINKNVKVIEKIYNYPSKMFGRKAVYEGILTFNCDEYIELDGKKIIFKKYIFSIELK